MHDHDYDPPQDRVLWHNHQPLTGMPMAQKRATSAITATTATAAATAATDAIAATDVAATAAVIGAVAATAAGYTHP